MPPPDGAVSTDDGSAASAAPASDARRTLAVVGVNHALHDGYADVLYVLLPVWQTEYGLGYGALALVRALFVGAMAALQLPSARLAGFLGARLVLVAGTLLGAVGFALAGASGGLVGLCAALALAGAGSSTQHPLASAVIARVYGRGARGPLGTYNFTGDVGKAAAPPLVGFLLTWWDWRSAAWLLAALGVVVAVALLRFLPAERPSRSASSTAPIPASGPPPRGTAGGGGFRLLVAIGMLDNAARPAFLMYLPFLLGAKGAGLTLVGFALSRVADVLIRIGSARA